MLLTRQGFVFESFPSQIIHSANSQTSFNKCFVDKLHHNGKEMRVAAVPRFTSCPHLLLFDFFFPVCLSPFPPINVSFAVFLYVQHPLRLAQ